MTPLEKYKAIWIKDLPQFHKRMVQRVNKEKISNSRKSKKIKRLMMARARALDYIKTATYDIGDVEKKVDDIYSWALS